MTGDGRWGISLHGAAARRTCYVDVTPRPCAKTPQFSLLDSQEHKLPGRLPITPDNGRSLVRFDYLPAFLD